MQNTDKPLRKVLLFTLTRIGARHRSRRGSALLLVILLLCIFSVTATMVMSLVTTTVRSAHVRTDQFEAFNMADAGIDLGEAWLEQQSASAPPDSSTLRNLTNFWGTNGTFNAPFGLAGSTLTVTIYSDAGNVGPVQKKYLIEAKAVMPSGVTQIVRAYLRQVSFAKYAFFTHDDGGGFWDYNNHFEGPFHSNDGDGNPSEFLWTQKPTSGPIFDYNGTDAFSDSGNPTWWLNTIGNTHPPAATSDYNAIALGGQPTMVYGYQTDVNGNQVRDSNGNLIPNSPIILLPTTDYAQEYAALGMVPPSPCTAPAPNLPTTNGAVVTSGGGIYIHGDSQVALSVDGNGNQVVKVTSTYLPGGTNLTGGTTVQTITVNTASGTSGATMVSVKTPTTGAVTTTTTATTVPLNGLIFSDGNITALSGTVANNRVSNGVITTRNSMTIGTDTAASKNIYLSGSVKYATSRNLSVAQPLDSGYNLNAGILGLEGANVYVQSGAPAQVEFDACIFCTGTFAAVNPNSPVGNAGTMTEIGGVIVHDAGIFAYGDQYGNVVSGYNEQYHYDQRLADYPPPYFPTTGNHYDIISWQNVSATIQ